MRIIKFRAWYPKEIVSNPSSGKKPFEKGEMDYFDFIGDEDVYYSD